METPIDMKAGIALLGKMELIEFALEAAIIGDAGPLTCSPTQRRNLALILADVAAEFCELADRIDPLAAPAEDGDDEATIRWEAIRATSEEGRTPFVLPDGAFEAAVERVGTPAYLEPVES
jgi:hypothetical protein